MSLVYLQKCRQNLWNVLLNTASVKLPRLKVHVNMHIINDNELKISDRK